MKSADNQRYAYGKAQLVEVICQLRFPTILSIDTREPAEFQEMIRDIFPRYTCQIEKLPPVSGVQQSVKNHMFLSEDGGYKLSMTKDFIALSTIRYTNWEDFARLLDEPLGKFMELSRNVQSGNTQNLKRSAVPVRLPAAPAPTRGTSQAAAPAGCAYGS